MGCADASTSAPASSGHHGQMVATGSPIELKRRVGRDVVEVDIRDRRDLATIAELLGHTSSYFVARALIWTVAIIALALPAVIATYRRG